MFAGNFAPANWAFCDGSTLPIAPNVALFEILGTQYGGDGSTNFALPKLDSLPSTGAVAAAVRYVICVQGMFPQRE